MIDWLFVIVIGLAFVAALWPTKTRIPVAVIELIIGIFLGVVLFVIRPVWATESGHEWLSFLATIGSLMILFLAGAETKLPLNSQSYKGAKSGFGIGRVLLASFFSFLLPFLAATAFSLYYLKWSLPASLIVGLALAETSVAVVYVVLIEGGLTETSVGQKVLSITFTTNIIVAVVLGVVGFFFFKPEVQPFSPAINSFYFIGLVALFLFLAWKFLTPYFTQFVANEADVHAGKILSQSALKGVLFLLFTVGLFAEFGGLVAALPAYIVGYILGPALRAKGKVTNEMARFRVFAFGLFAPVLFIYAGLRVSYEAFFAGLGIILALFFIKVLTKFVANVSVLGIGAQQTERAEAYYASWLLATGLTIGTIISVLGLEAGVLDSVQFSILEGAIIISAVIPTLIAEWTFGQQVHQKLKTGIKKFWTAQKSI